MRNEILQGDVRDVLPTLPSGSVHCIVTSPPYFGLRNYGVAGQLGLEPTIEEYVANLVAVFRECRRVLRDDGQLWLNLGDSYAADRGNQVVDNKHRDVGNNHGSKVSPGLKPKDLCMIPARVALALQADGWWLRSDIIWAKPNPMPESVTDRPTSAHEHVFLLTKRAKYFYDAEAVREANSPETQKYFERYKPEQKTITERTKQLRASGDGIGATRVGAKNRAQVRALLNPAGRNRRNVWTIASESYKEAHFATFPRKLVEPCILAGTSARGVCECGAPWARVVEREAATSKKCPKTDAYYQAQGGNGEKRTGTIGMSGGGRIDGTTTTTGWRPTCDCPPAEPRPALVLDPFFGSGTVGAVAVEAGRDYLGIELNPDYIELARRRIGAAQPALFARGL